jgi:hypothetical protein
MIHRPTEEAVIRRETAFNRLIRAFFYPLRYKGKIWRDRYDRVVYDWAITEDDRKHITLNKDLISAKFEIAEMQADRAYYS